MTIKSRTRTVNGKKIQERWIDGKGWVRSYGAQPWAAVTPKRILSNIKNSFSKKTNKDELKTNTTKSTDTTKKAKKISSIERRNRKIHGDEAIDALKKRHEEFKAKRKAGTHRKRKLTRAEELRKRTGR